MLYIFKNFATQLNIIQANRQKTGDPKEVFLWFTHDLGDWPTLRSMWTLIFLFALERPWTKCTHGRVAIPLETVRKCIGFLKVMLSNEPRPDISHQTAHKGKLANILLIVHRSAHNYIRSLLSRECTASPQIEDQLIVCCAYLARNQNTHSFLPTENLNIYIMFNCFFFRFSYLPEEF